MSIYHLRQPDGLQEIRGGQVVVINDHQYRVRSINYKVAEEDDPELGIKAGDYYYTVEMEPVVLFSVTPS